MKYTFKNRFYIFLIGILDLLGRLLFSLFRIFRKKLFVTVNNILLIRLDHIGDVIFATSIN
jgi:hypothetical protein